MNLYLNGNQYFLLQMLVRTYLRLVEKYKYNFDLDVALPPLAKYVSSPDNTPPPGAKAFTIFVKIANKIKMMCKKAANEKKKTILKTRAKKPVEFLWSAKFSLWGFKLDYQHIFLIVTKVVDTIGLKYGRLSI